MSSSNEPIARVGATPVFMQFATTVNWHLSADNCYLRSASTYRAKSPSIRSLSIPWSIFARDANRSILLGLYCCCFCSWSRALPSLATSMYPWDDVVRRLTAIQAIQTTNEEMLKSCRRFCKFKINKQPSKTRNESKTLVYLSAPRKVSESATLAL